MDNATEHDKQDEYGLPYSLDEARKLANHPQTDLHHKEVILRICDQLEAKEFQLQDMPPKEHSLALLAASKILLDQDQHKWSIEEQEAMAKFVQRASAFTKLPERPMFCELCNGTSIDTEQDVGWDVDESGEERQNLDTCLKCGATRSWSSRMQNFNTLSVIWGRWHKANP